jgi:hypothetical protein
LITTDRNGYKAVAYSSVVPVLVEAIRAQQKKIEALEKQNVEITELKAQIAVLTATLREVKAAQDAAKPARR